ncbi:MAG: LysR family transcriptional regulator [Agarilytica sp.]
MVPKISLEQWAAFKAVVDEGSFVKAADALNKSQSTVSYNLARMEERLPSPVFVQAGRKAELTEFGHAMYRHGSALLEQALLVDQSAAYLASGWESEVVIAVDGIAPMDRVFCGLQRFSLESPHTRIRVLETILSGTEETLLRREADVVITARVPPGFLSQDFGEVHKVPVASPDHPILKLDAPINEDQLKQFRQIVIRDSGLKREQNSGWLGSEQRWTVSHFASSIEALKSGLGFGFVPREKIKQELESGDLVELPLALGAEQVISLYVVASAQNHAGLATKAVIRHLLDGGVR